MARPVGQVERFTRWCRKNPSVAGLSAAVLLLLLAVTGVSVSFAVERELARQSITAARDNAEQARDRAREILETVCSESGRRTLLGSGEGEETSEEDRRLLENMVAYYGQLAGKADTESARRRQAETYMQLGAVLQAQKEMSAQARSAFQEALGRYQQLVEELGKVQDREQLAVCYKSLGDTSNGFQDRQECYRQALAVRAEIARSQPGKPEYLDALVLAYDEVADALAAIDRRRDADQAFREAGAIDQTFADPKYRQRAAARLHKLAALLKGWDQSLEAEAAHREAVAIRKKLVEDHPGVIEYRKELVASDGLLAEMLATLGRKADAEAAYQDAIAAQKKIVTDFQGDSSHRGQLARLLTDLAIRLATSGKLPDAAAAHQDALAIRDQLAVESPKDTDYPWSASYNLTNLGLIYTTQGQWTEAEAAHRKALDLREKLANEHADEPKYRADVAQSYTNLGNMFLAQGKPKESEAAHRRSIEVLQQLIQGQSKDVAYLRRLASACDRMGRILVDRNESGEAVAFFRAEREARKELAGRQEAPPEDLNNFAWFLATCPDAQFLDPARAVELAERAVNKEPDNIKLNTLGVARYRVGDWKGAVSNLERALALRKPSDPLNAYDGFFLAMACWRLNDRAKSREWNNRAVQWMQSSMADDLELKRFAAEAAELLGVERMSPVPSSPEKKDRPSSIDPG